MKNLISKTENIFKTAIKFKQFAAIFIFALVFINFSPDFVFAQNHCGREDQRPCRLWERIPSCNKGLKEDFRKDRCVSTKSEIRQSVLRMCNDDSTEIIDFVVVLWDSQEKQWMAQGWYQIDETECTNVEIPPNYKGYVAVYAEIEGKTWIGDFGNFCVPTVLKSQFRLPDRRNCHAPNYKRVDLFGIWFEPATTQTQYLETSFK